MFTKLLFEIEQFDIVVIKVACTKSIQIDWMDSTRKRFVFWKPVDRNKVTVFRKLFFLTMWVVRGIENRKFIKIDLFQNWVCEVYRRLIGLNLAIIVSKDLVFYRVRIVN